MIETILWSVTLREDCSPVGHTLHVSAQEYGDAVLGAIDACAEDLDHNYTINDVQEVKKENTIWVAETRPVTEDTSSHLVRAGETLCGLSQWHAGNVDLAFGVNKGVTDCIACLRVFASELLASQQN